MVILFDSDKVGIALGLFVFLIIIVMGLHGNVAPAVVVARALVGLAVAYALGFILSRCVINALVTAMATERAKKFAGRTKKKPEQSEEGAETEEENSTP
jgi:hypothetical protein